MAKPQTENGFVMVALDLFGAVLACGLSTYAQIVLAEVIAQSYGPAKVSRVYLHGTEFNELTGIDRNSARKAIAELVSANILKAVGQGYTFNKDYESWTPKMGRLEERIGGRILGWIAGLNDRLGTKTHKKLREATQPQKHAPTEATQPHQTDVSEATQPQKHAPTEATQPQRHIEEAPARLRAEELRAEDSLPASRPPAINFDPSLSEADRIGEEVEGWFPNAGWGVDAFEMCRTTDSWAVEWGFRTGYQKSLNGERVSLKRIIGLIKYAEANPMAPEIRGPAIVPKPSAGRGVPSRTPEQQAELTRKLKERSENNGRGRLAQ